MEYDDPDIHPGIARALRQRNYDESFLSWVREYLATKDLQEDFDAYLLRVHGVVHVEWKDAQPDV